jgi:chromosome segregation ATPase
MHMINLEQVKLLETKVSKTIDFVEKVSKENTALLRREAELQEKLETYQKRIDELEVLIMGFKEEQGRIEDGILAALDRLSQFEEAIEKSLKEKHQSKSDGGHASGSHAAGSRHAAKDTGKSSGHNAPQKKPAKEEAAPRQDEEEEEQTAADFGVFDEKVCFEIPDDEPVDDILDPLNEALDEEAGDGNSPAEGGELDIF